MTRKDWLILIALGIAGVGYLALTEAPQGDLQSNADITPDWAAISAWPAQDADQTEAMPDPNRQITAIVLDDSGSMGSDIEPAKAAIMAALESMQPDDRVAVVALNHGTIHRFSTV
jgi:hypothetical protein